MLSLGNVKLASLFKSKERGIELNIIVSSCWLIQLFSQESKFNFTVIVNLINCMRTMNQVIPDKHKWTICSKWKALLSYIILLLIQGTEMLSNEPYTWEVYSCYLYRKSHLIWSVFCQPYFSRAMKYRKWKAEEILGKFNHTEIQFR